MLWVSMLFTRTYETKKTKKNPVKPCGLTGLMYFLYFSGRQCGARSENRTRTALRPRDFKSLVSTYSTIRAMATVYSPVFSLSKDKLRKNDNNAL